MEGAQESEAKMQEPPAETVGKAIIQQVNSAANDEQRYMVPTKNGLIDEVIVQKYKEAHSEAI